MDEAVTKLEAADIAKVMAMLPHRYPFLLVDRVIDIKGDEHGIGIKNVTINEPHFQGHFPENPVFPGVLMIEGMAQTAGIICVRALGQKSPKNVFFMTIDKAKFRKPVIPGDTIEYHMTRIAQRRNRNPRRRGGRRRSPVDRLGAGAASNWRGLRGRNPR